MKRRAKAAQEGEEKPFGSSAVFGFSAETKTNKQLRRRRNQTSAGPALLTHQMMDSLEEYLDNITAAATQTAAKEGTTTDLAASLPISVDNVAQQQQEIKSLYKQINDLKKRGTQAAGVRKLTRGGLVGTTVCTHCEAVRHTTPHRKNACYFDPRKMIDQKEWT